MTEFVLVITLLSMNGEVEDRYYHQMDNLEECVRVRDTVDDYLGHPNVVYSCEVKND